MLGNSATASFLDVDRCQVFFVCQCVNDIGLAMIRVCGRFEVNELCQHVDWTESEGLLPLDGGRPDQSESANEFSRDLPITSSRRSRLRTPTANDLPIW